MVELGNLNLIIEEDGNSKCVTSEIINFIDLTGVNVIYVTNILYSNGLPKCKKIHMNIDEIDTKLKENLFRIEHIFFECTSNRIPEFYKEIRRITTIPITFITNNKDFIKIDEFDYVYNTWKENENINFGLSFEENKKSYIIEDLKNNWKSNIPELKKSWIRNKKLEDLFGEEDQ
jgi:hypothetical protein